MSVEDPRHNDTRTGWFAVRRVVPAGLLLAGAALFFALGLHRYLSFEEIARHRHALVQWREHHEATAALLFILAYLAAVALSIPGAIWLTILGGFLFGAVLGSLYAVVGATAGACTVFLAARFLVGDLLRRKAAPAIRRMEAGFRKHAFHYMLFLRLMPVFPFWLVNLVPAFLGVRLRTFALGTLLGIIPGSLVYALVGSGLGAVIDRGEQPDLEIVFTPSVLAPLTGLALLALAPIVWRHLRRGAPSADREP